MQLNVGDLMRQHSHWITEQDPKNDENNEGIKSEWQKVESALKDDTPSKKDQVPDFLGHWLTSRGSKVTAKKVFTELKEELENYKKSANEYDKSEVLTWFKEIEVCSELYKQIVEAEDGEDHCLIMRGIDGVGKQHRALFLSGMRVFQKNGMKNEMIRLIKIFEYMTLKGVLIPSAMEIDGIPSNEIYGWINDWCTEIDKKSKSYKAKITTPIAKDLLDEMAVKVKNKCDSVWSAAAASDGIKWDAESMKKLVVSQNQARLILTRIEMSKSGTKVWTRDMEVEHVLPQKWNKDWSNKRKGGDFKESTYKDYVNYLGNRSLLDPGSNKKLSNRGFREKQNVVDHGYDAQAKNWKITEDLSSKKKKLWNPKEIESRTKNLAEKMIGIYNDSFLGL
jgi:hypothetical protein